MPWTSGWSAGWFGSLWGDNPNWLLGGDAATRAKSATGVSVTVGLVLILVLALVLYVRFARRTATGSPLGSSPGNGAKWETWPSSPPKKYGTS